MNEQIKLQIMMGNYTITVEKIESDEPNPEDPMNTINNEMIRAAFDEINNFIKKNEDKAQ